MSIEEEYYKAMKRCKNRCEWESVNGRCKTMHCLRMSLATKSKSLTAENMLYLCPIHYQKNENHLRPPPKPRVRKTDLQQISMFD